MNRRRTVWRVETNEGVGLYQSGAPDEMSRNGTADLYSGTLHPGPWDTLVGWKDIDCACKADDFRFGFPTLKAAKRWLFDPEVRQFLEDYGLHLFKYEVDANTALVNNRQVAFVKATATRGERRSIRSLSSISLKRRTS